MGKPTGLDRIRRENVANALLRHDGGLFREDTRLHLRDVYDHTMQIIELLESYRETAMDLMNVHLSVLSNRLNEAMRVLTVIATIFIPLTFVAGVYGMNFQFMPEIGWRYGYLFFWGVIVAVAAGMLAYFRRQKWF